MKMKINVVGEYELERFLKELKKINKYDNDTYDDVTIGYVMGMAYIDLTEAKVAMIKFILENKNLFVEDVNCIEDDTEES